MKDKELVEKTAEFVKEKFRNEGSGHDWWHLYRVWQLSKHIAKQEKDVDMLVVELAALLHDIADHKFHDGDMEIGPKKARAWLEELEAPEDVVRQVEDIVRNISFKGAKSASKNNLNTIEGQIVHDADKLDAMGAIGIARLFTMAGTLQEPIHDPEVPIGTKHDMSETRTISATHHIYEKLLLLKDRMFTKTGKQMARHRHEYIEKYLEEFYAEWDGKM